MQGFVPAALAAWATCLGAIVGLALGVAPTTVATGLGLGAALAALAAAVAALGRRWAAVAAALVAAVAAVSALGYVQSVTREPLGDTGSRVIAEARVIGDMRVRDGFAGPSLDVRAHVESVTHQGTTWRVGSPVILRMGMDQAPPIGSVVNVTGSLMPGDPTRGFGAGIDVEDIVVIQSPGAMGLLAGTVRGSLRTALEGAPPRSAALVEGLAVGDETQQPEELEEQMRIAGLSHLTAVSGGNTSIVVGAVLLVTSLLGAGLVLRVATSAVALGAFVVIVGPQPSVLRAAVMAVVALVAILSGGRRHGLHALAFACVVLLILSPALATSWGFALSVAATGGLVVLAGPLLRRWGGEGRARRAVVSALALTVGAQVATLPLIATFGDGLSLVAVPANLLAAPAVAPVTVLGLLAAIVGVVAPGIAVVLARLAEPFAAWIAWVAQVSASTPVATLPWPGGLLGAGLALGVAAVLVFVIRRHRGRHERRGRPRTLALVAVIIAVVATLALRVPERAGWPPPGWIAAVCDVGQGDALVLRGLTGGAILVDAGPDPAAVDQCLDDLGVDRIELLVLTHHHADHVAGVPGVLAGRAVSAALVSPLQEPVEQVRLVEGWLGGIPVSSARAGERRIVDGMELTVLWPQRIIRGSESAPNNASIVLLANVRGVRFLLLGDVEIAAQVALRTSLAAPGVDVVKVAHHGSRLQDPALAAWTAGRIALISVGADNDYGHPAPETVSSWLDAGALVARTDEAGDIAIVLSPLGVVTRRTSTD